MTVISASFIDPAPARSRNKKDRPKAVSCTYDNMMTAVPSTDGSVSFFDTQKPPAQGLKQGQRVSRSPLPQSDLTSRVRCGEAQLKLNALPCCC
jgi:hypothetical protein